MDELAERLNSRAKEMMGLWVDANTGALISLSPPSLDDPFAEQNFYVALGGNLLWAATSLMPEWTVPMSFGGAVLAGGAAAQSPPAPPPSLIAKLILKIHACRDRNVAAVSVSVGEIARQMEAMGLTDHEQQDRELWRRLFGNIEYENSEALLAAALQILQRATDAYTAQYRKWQSATLAEALRRLDMMKDFSFETHRAPLSALGAALPFLVDQVRREFPWDPESFDPLSLQFRLFSPRIDRAPAGTTDGAFDAD